MREELLGYLLGALEPDETRELSACLASDAALRRDLEEMQQLVRPLAVDLAASDVRFLDPPRGLADRVCEHLRQLCSATDADTAASSGDAMPAESFTISASSFPTT